MVYLQLARLPKDQTVSYRSHVWHFKLCTLSGVDSLSVCKSQPEIGMKLKVRTVDQNERHIVLNKQIG